MSKRLKTFVTTMDGENDSRKSRKRASTSATEATESKVFKSSLFDDSQQIIELLSLENNRENVQDVMTRLANHADNENRLEVVIEELLFNPTNGGNITNNGQQKAPIDDSFFIDVSNLVSILQTAHPDERPDENLVYETLLKYSDNLQRVSIAYQELLNRHMLNVLQSQTAVGPSPESIQPLDGVINLTDDSDDDMIDIDPDGDLGVEDVDDIDEVAETTEVVGNPLAGLERARMLTDIFPDVDERWLWERLEEHGQNPDCIMVISNLMSERSYPKRELKSGPTRDELKSIWFDDDEFLKLHPNPTGYFHHSDGTQRPPPTASYIKNALHELVMEFKTIRSSQIEKLFMNTMSYSAARWGLSKTLKRKRKNEEYPRPKKYQVVPENADETFFREFWFAKNEERLRKILEERETMRMVKMTEARNNGMFFTCPICYDDEVLPDEVLSCITGHEFCPSCIRRGAEIAIGEGRTRFACLSDECKSEFSSSTLLSILPQSMYDKVLDRKLEEELKELGADNTDLVQCPFCIYVVSMPDPDDRLLRCRNPDCMKESCRYCKEPNHVPLRCEEVEKAGEMDFRKQVEMEMTEAMIRTCPKCHKRFFKVDGCNKMTCTCGTTMCYLCRKANVDYNHFNDHGLGCKLHTDMNEVHTREVQEAAEKAKVNFARDNPDVHLKHDPTDDLKSGGGAKPKKKGR